MKKLIAQLLVVFTLLVTSPSAYAASFPVLPLARTAQLVVIDIVYVEQVGDSIMRGDGCASQDSIRQRLYTKALAEGITLQFVGPTAGGGTSANGNRHDAIAGAVITTLTSGMPGSLSGATAAQPQVIIDNLGTNDANSGSGTIAAVPTNLGAHYDAIRAYSPTIPILASVIFSPLSLNTERGQVQTHIRNTVNGRLSTDTNLILVDLGALFTTSGNMTDDFHPNCTGYDALGDIYWTYLKLASPVSVLLWSSYAVRRHEATAATNSNLAF